MSNYVEAFAGSLAVLLRRPADHFAGRYRVETVNDADHFLVNVWRSIRNDPDAVAFHADRMVMEAEMHAIHRYLMRGVKADEFRKGMVNDPDYYDPKVAGMWLYGICCWIGSGWCSHGAESVQIPDMDGGRGVLAPATSADRHGRPQLADAFDLGRGVNGGAGELSRQRPDLGGGNSFAIGGVSALPQIATTEARRAWLTDWMRRLADRLRLVRTCYGHWSRICDSDSTLTRLGTTGVFLDPPYALDVARSNAWIKHLMGDGPEPGKPSGKKSRADGLYSNDSTQDVDRLVAEVNVWCQKWGGNPDIRIAVCGYDGEHNNLEDLGWEKVYWASSGGYGNQSKSKKGKATNAGRERIWFSPFALQPRQRGLFDELEREPSGFGKESADGLAKMDADTE